MLGPVLTVSISPTQTHQYSPKHRAACTVEIFKSLQSLIIIFHSNKNWLADWTGASKEGREKIFSMISLLW